MIKKPSFILLSIVLIAGCAAVKSPTSSLLFSNKIGILEPFKDTDCLLILSPHPDDEAIGCAGIIQGALNQGAKVKIVYLTNGDHNQVAFIIYEKRLTLRRGEFIHMGEVRRKEAIKAMKLLGLNESDLIFFGYPDFGTFTIFNRYWQETRPFRSWLTHISSVPYKENFSYGAPYKGESILDDLKKVLLDYKPNKIFVSHPADVNVDHKTFYLFLEVALADLRNEIPVPKIYPYLIHCVGWPVPRHYHPVLTLEPPQKFLDSSINWRKFNLAQDQLDKKHQATLCYKSQTESSAFYLLAFARQNELFGDYPVIELEEEETKSLFNSLRKFIGLDKPAGSDKSAKSKAQVTYTINDDNFLIRIYKTKGLSHRLNIRLYLFGYNYKTPFAQMPKICILTKGNRFKVFDKKKMIKPEGLRIQRSAKEFILSIPLEAVGDPDFMLVSAKAHAEILPMDVVGFRKINIR